MKKYISIAFLLTLTFAFTVNAQDFRRLEKLANELKQQSADLVSRTNKEIKKDGIHSSKQIKSAFLAEQFRASVVLIDKLIDSRFHKSEVRYAGMVLTELSDKFPLAGRNSFEWKTAKDTINELSRELRGLNVGANIEKIGYVENDGTILGTAIWSGMVDDNIVLSVKGEKIFAETISGKSFDDGAYRFTSTIPKQERIRVGVRLKSGRGKAHVIEQPGNENNYTAVIQVRDEEGGAKPYSIEIFWYRR